MLDWLFTIPRWLWPGVRWAGDAFGNTPSTGTHSSERARESSRPSLSFQLEGTGGVAVMAVPGVGWHTIDEAVLMRTSFENREQWPLYLAFDVLLANVDRHQGNILVELNDPEASRVTGVARSIDYGFGGLWPPRKFGDGLDAADLENLDPEAVDWTPDWLDHFAATDFRPSCERAPTPLAERSCPGRHGRRPDGETPG
jgi:hypothetical protein